MRNPEDFIGPKVELDEHSKTHIWSVDGEHLQHILDVRGWGAIQHLFPQSKIGQDNAAKFQDQIGQFIVDAINEKLASIKSPRVLIKVEKVSRNVIRLIDISNGLRIMTVDKIDNEWLYSYFKDKLKK